MMIEERRVILRSESAYGKRVPPSEFGEFLKILPIAIERSIRMAFEGRSTSRGRRPSWLDRASDIRFTGIEGKDDTVLRFEAPTLGSAAAELYEQTELWANRPNESDTGFDVLSDVIEDVTRKIKDSDRFDRSLLSDIRSFRRALNGTFQSLAIESSRERSVRSVTLDKDTTAIADGLSRDTPEPSRVRIAGKLDMIRASTRTFAIVLPEGEEVRCVLEHGEVNVLTEFLEKDILVIGTAIFRPSRSLLRVDVLEIRPASINDNHFYRIPRPRGKALDLRELHHEIGRKSDIKALIGKWPGDESDEEFEAILRELA